MQKTEAGSLPVETHGDESRMEVKISGIVQGVGFRPFIYTLALKHSVRGFVRNISGQVEVSAQGSYHAISEFIKALEQDAPPLASIDSIKIKASPLQIPAPTGFYIIDSSRSGDSRLAVPPDTTTCDTCLQELFDAADRRFRYPFINCTDCGPRFSIIRSLPYDRPLTCMSSFRLCRECRLEYDNPANRRFHAQSNACQLCGPRLSFLRSARASSASALHDATSSEVALKQALSVLNASGILAIKGLGGFHLACDARDTDAIKTLRQRKVRYGKPLAVMMKNLDAVREYCSLSPDEAVLLTRAERPIVLLPAHSLKVLPEEVASGVDVLGVMLPYTPLHHLLMHDLEAPLVMTSGNRGQEPIATDNQEAVDRLSSIADAFLLHDRPIATRLDDSVTRIVGSTPTVIRRSRGWAPLPIHLPFASAANTLACGAQLKNTFSLIKEATAYVSQHIGDLENLETLESFEIALDNYMRLFQFNPELIVCDLHPDYLSTALAMALSSRLNIPALQVQHHHAHIVSCMVEHGIQEPVIGVAFDGFGLGDDGTLWGGEFLLCDWYQQQRLAHFAPTPAPGGKAAATAPWRMALGYIFSETGDVSAFAPFLSSTEKRVGSATVDVVAQQVKRRFNAPLTSSCGRLFDAMSAMLDICPIASYEGQAAVELECRAWRALRSDGFRPEPYPVELIDGENVTLINSLSLLRSAAHDYSRGQDKDAIALRFHTTITEIIVRICLKARLNKDIDKVCLSGGVFQNQLLLTSTVQRLQKAGFKVFFPSKLPANDGGISLGQATIALAQSGKLSRLSERQSK